MFKFLKLYFEEITDKGNTTQPVHWDAIHDFGNINFNPDGTMKIPDQKMDEQGQPVVEKKEEKVEDKKEEVVKEESTETPEEDSEESTTEGSEENTEESKSEDSTTEEDTTEESKEPSILEKRLKDTQKAYHEGQQKIKELSARVEKLEKPVEKKSDELTLSNIDPKILQESMTKDPIMTTRWIVDQQTKMSISQQQEVVKQQQLVQEKEARKAASEEIATKRFPVIDKIISLSDDQLKTFKTDHPEQYEFAMKTIEYQKSFEERGDEEALLNAASRAYAELSPKALESIKIELTKAITKAQTNKQNTVKQATVSSGAGTKSNKQGKKPSASEFFNMKPQEQNDAMYADFQTRLANINKNKK